MSLNIDEGMTRYLPSGSSLGLMLDTHWKLDCYIHWLKNFISGNILRYVFVVFLLSYLKGINIDQTRDYIQWNIKQSAHFRRFSQIKSMPISDKERWSMGISSATPPPQSGANKSISSAFYSESLVMYKYFVVFTV